MKNAPGMHQSPGWTLILISYIVISVSHLFNLSEWCDFGSFDWRWRVFISRQLRHLNRAQIWCCPLSLGRRDFTTTSTRICSKLVRPGQFPIRIHQAIPCYQISQSQCTSASWVTRIILDFWCFKRPFLLQQYLCSPDRSTLGLGHIALRDLHSCATQNQIHLKNWNAGREVLWRKHEHVSRCVNV